MFQITCTNPAAALRIAKSKHRQVIGYWMKMDTFLMAKEAMDDWVSRPRTPRQNWEAMGRPGAIMSQKLWKTDAIVFLNAPYQLETLRKAGRLAEVVYVCPPQNWIAHDRWIRCRYPKPEWVATVTDLEGEFSIQDVATALGKTHELEDMLDTDGAFKKSRKLCEWEWLPDVWIRKRPPRKDGTPFWNWFEKTGGVGIIPNAEIWEDARWNIKQGAVWCETLTWRRRFRTRPVASTWQRYTHLQKVGERRIQMHKDFLELKRTITHLKGNLKGPSEAKNPDLVQP